MILAMLLDRRTVYSAVTTPRLDGKNLAYALKENRRRQRSRLPTERGGMVLHQLFNRVVLDSQPRRHAFAEAAVLLPSNRRAVPKNYNGFFPGAGRIALKRPV